MSSFKRYILVCFCMLQPAAPSWLTSTGPPLLWDDTSPKPRYTLFGKQTRLMAAPPFSFFFSIKILNFLCLSTSCRNVSNVVDYQLTFVLPEDQLEELRNFTLSKEMVHNVFRQFLYEQDQDSASTYIIPVSLIMSSRH